MMDNKQALSKNILDTINSPADVKALSMEELKQLAEEIRQLLISVIAKTGGHLAPNLGVVELTLALHRVFSTPEDKIVFDIKPTFIKSLPVDGSSSRLCVNMAVSAAFLSAAKALTMLSALVTPARRFLQL